MQRLNNNGLTHQQQIFVDEYIKTSNGIMAIEKSYPKCKNWTKNAKHVQINKLLNHPKINLIIQKYNEDIANKLKNSVTLNKRKILNEIIELQQTCKKSGNSQNPTNIQALKLLSQISGLLQDNKQDITINNNINMADVSTYLDL